MTIGRKNRTRLVSGFCTVIADGLSTQYEFGGQTCACTIRDAQISFRFRLRWRNRIWYTCARRWNQRGNLFPRWLHNCWKLLRSEVRSKSSGVVSGVPPCLSSSQPAIGLQREDVSIAITKQKMNGFEEMNNGGFTSIDGILSDVQVDLVAALKNLDQQEPPKRPNVLVCGYTGSGKTTLIKAILGDVVPEDAIGAGLPQTAGYELYVNEGGHIAIYDSKGTEQGDSLEDFKRNTTRFIDETRKCKNAGEHINLAWYVISGAGDRIQDFDRSLIKDISSIAPVIVVITKNDITKDNTRESFKRILAEEVGIDSDHVIFTSCPDGKPSEGCKSLVAESIKLLPDACRLEFIRSQVCDARSKIEAEMERILKAATRPLIDLDKIGKFFQSGKEGITNVLEWANERLPWTKAYQKRQEELANFKKKVYIAGTIMTVGLLALWRILACVQEGHYSLSYIGVDLLVFIGSILAIIGTVALCALAFIHTKLLGWTVLFLIMSILAGVGWLIGESLLEKGFAVAYVSIGFAKYLVFFLVPACLGNLFLMVYGSTFEDYYNKNGRSLRLNFYGACRCWLSLTAGWIDTTKNITTVAWGILKRNPRKAIRAVLEYFKPSWL